MVQMDLGHIVNTGQQWTTFLSATCICDAVFSSPGTPEAEFDLDSRLRNLLSALHKAELVTLTPEKI